MAKLRKVQGDLWGRPDQYKVHLPSPEEIAAAQTGPGGWKANQLAQWGVPWPPPAGWRAELERRWREKQHVKKV